MLVQDADEAPDTFADWKTVTSEPVPEDLVEEVRFAWQAVRGVKSNAIVITADRTVRGVGGGQTSRVDSVEIALKKAGDYADGGVLASDAFFPFPDGVERAAAAGIAAIIQPGGSVQDEAVIAAAEDAGGCR